KTLRTAVPYATTRHTRALSTAFFSSMIPPPPTSTLFPYTTLFRSCDDGARRSELVIARGGCRGIRQPTGAVHEESVAIAPRGQWHDRGPHGATALGRSHRGACGVPVVEVADQRHPRGAWSDDDELKRARRGLGGRRFVRPSA